MKTLAATYLKTLLFLTATAFICGGLFGQTDLQLEKASYFGGAGDELAPISRQKPIAALADGGWYMGLTTYSPDFWTSSDAYQSAMPDWGAMGITRFNPTGVPVYSTYLGGSNFDTFLSLAPLGNSIVIGGFTSSDDFPVSDGAFQTVYPGVQSGVLTCLNDDGDLAWSTFIGGGEGFSSVAGVHVSVESAIFITGFTHHPNLATPGVHMESFAMGQTSSHFIARFDQQGALIWCTYYDRRVDGISSSPTGDLIFLYGTEFDGPNIDFNTHQQQFGGGELDVFLSCFDATTGTLVWETYFGGEDEDWAGGIKVAEDGLVYITGYTASTTGIATSGTHQEERSGPFDAFLACFNVNGLLEWGTYYGGELWESFTGIPTIAGGSIYFGGLTSSTQGIAFGNPLQPALLSSAASYLAKFNRFNGTLHWATYTTSTQAGGCRLRNVESLADSKILLTGSATSACSGLVTPDAWQPAYGGGDFDLLYAIYTDNTLSATTGALQNTLHIFPNPAREYIHIQRGGAQSNDAFSVYDISGRTVMQGFLTPTQTQLHVEHLPAGLYLLRVEERQYQKTLKFVKE